MNRRPTRLTLLAALLLAGAFLAGCAQPQESDSLDGNETDDGMGMGNETMGNQTDEGEPGLPGFNENATLGPGPYDSV